MTRVRRPRDAGRKPLAKARWNRDMVNAGVASLLSMAAMFAIGRTLTADTKPVSHDPVQVVDPTTLELSDEAAANLETAQVAQQSFPDVLSLMGTISVVENRVTSVPARVAGRIDAVMRVSGEYVKAGDALALEYSPDFITARQEYLEAMDKDASVHAAAAQAASPTAQDRGENADFSNLAALTVKKLKNMGLTDADIAALPTALDTTHLVIRAGRDGAITAVNTAVGNMQNQGDVLMTVSDLDRVWFSGDLYAEDLGKVHHGQKIQVMAEGLKSPVAGVISFISPVIDAGAHTIKVRALIDNPERALRGGMVVQGDLVLS
ncbi:MAG TPA: efflux RND transporter periplasmic adaptor subunit, partial [bacterium]|nr:efflux RND transporter periplasmic adaptor subunit [bacterium]